MLKIFFTIFLWYFFSQVFYLGVFAEWWYIVLRESDTLCGIFTPWNTWTPNWLPEWWYSAKFYKDFQETESCTNKDVVLCCSDNSLKYAGVTIGINKIDEKRKSAEFLASKKIIENNSLQASKYRLDDTVTRKEIMKVIANTSKLSLKKCQWIFDDVVDDWGCPYIEAALQKWFITKNTFFRPNDTLTQTEALKLILEARNIEKRYVTQFWQQDYISTALYLWFIDKKYSDYNLPATRWWFFQVLARSYGDEFKNW